MASSGEKTGGNAWPVACSQLHASQPGLGRRPCYARAGLAQGGLLFVDIFRKTMRIHLAASADDAVLVDW